MVEISYSLAAKLDLLFDETPYCFVCGEIKTEVIVTDEGPLIVDDGTEDYEILRCEAVVCKDGHGIALTLLSQRYRCLYRYRQGGTYSNRLTGAASDRLRHDTIIDIDQLVKEIVLCTPGKERKVKQWIIDNIQPPS